LWARHANFSPSSIFCHQIDFIIDRKEKVPLLTSLNERSKGTTFFSFDDFERSFYVLESKNGGERL
jgi:hypothetical protein